MTSIVYPTPTAKATATAHIEHVLEAVRLGRAFHPAQPEVAHHHIMVARDLKMLAIALYPWIQVEHPRHQTPFDLVYDWYAKLRRLLRSVHSWETRVPDPMGGFLDWHRDEAAWARDLPNLPPERFKETFSEILQDLGYLLTMPWKLDHPTFAQLLRLFGLLHDWRQRIDRLQEDPDSDYKPPKELLGAFTDFLDSCGTVGAVSLGRSVHRLSDIDLCLDMLHYLSLAEYQHSLDHLFDPIEEMLEVELATLKEQ